MDLTQKAKQKGRCSSSRNPEETPSTKDLHRSMEIEVQLLNHQIARESKTGKEAVLCEALKEMVSYAKNISQGTEHREERLLTKVR